MNNPILSIRRRSPESARVLAALVSQVMAATPRQHARDWVLLIEPRLRLGNDVVVPDLAAWRRQSLNGREATEVVPDWVCDVVTGAGHAETSSYARLGVGVAWRVDPADCVVEVLARQDCGWWSTSHTLRLRAEPFQTIELDLQRLWVH